MVAYIQFLSTGMLPGQQLSGLGAGKMPELARAAAPGSGAAIYRHACLDCHGSNGEGIRHSLPTTDLGYIMPPLWGSDSFNDGAGMARLITAANFIHFNMPHGTDYLHPQLSTEESWDVAAYMLSQPRPRKAGLERDFPESAAKARRRALWPVRRSVQRRAAQVRSVRPDPRRDSETQGAEAIRAAAVAERSDPRAGFPCLFRKFSKRLPCCGPRGGGNRACQHFIQCNSRSIPCN